MLDFLGERQAAALLTSAVEQAVSQGALPRDVGDELQTRAVTDAVMAQLRQIAV